MENLLDHPCPTCKEEGSLKMLSLTAEIPYFGEHTQVTLSCDACGLRQTDFIPAEDKGALSHRLEISKPDHLLARVVRGSSGTVRLPEMDLEVSPGTHSTGYVSNVEGVIQRFIDIIEMVCRQASTDAQEGEQGADEAVAILSGMGESLSQLRDGEGLGEVSLEILDPSGHSAIAHEDAEVRELTADEIDELETGPNPLVFNASDDTIE